MKDANQSTGSQITGEGNEATGNQLQAIQSAAQISQQGANQLATSGAVFCAQGANAQAVGSDEAPEFYAQCNQVFNAAHGLNNSGRDFSPTLSTITGVATQKVFSQFESNFGVSRDDYLAHMLGKGAGRSALAELVSSKMNGEQLAQAFEKANALTPSELSKDAYAVNFGSSASRVPLQKGALRSRLAKSLANAREPASAVKGSDIEKPVRDAALKDLTPLENSFSPGETGGDPGLTLFDVVHRKYSSLAQRMHR
jgi:hypothetical protein